MWWIAPIFAGIGIWIAVTTMQEVQRAWRVPYILLFLLFMASAIVGSYFHTGPRAIVSFIAVACIIVALSVIWLTRRETP